MSNSFFRFRQFIIQQDRCAMKVSTDACVQGALTPVPQDTTRVLDIGAGTAMLSLMMAQRCPAAVIDALEIDAGAAAQAAENVAASPFADRVRVLYADAAEWAGNGALYNLVICNPPFFKNSLKGPAAPRNLARHVAGLSAKKLCELFVAHSVPDGMLSVMWPPEGHDVFTAAAAGIGLHLRQSFALRDRPSARITRIISIWSKRHADAAFAAADFIFKNENGSYSQQFRELLSPFYLHL